MMSIIAYWLDFNWRTAWPFLSVLIAFEVVRGIAAIVFGLGSTCGAGPAPHMPKRLTEVNVTEPVKPVVVATAEVAKPEPPRQLYPPPKRQMHVDVEKWLKFDTSPMVEKRERGLANRELY